jgi:hypothetical protein
MRTPWAAVLFSGLLVTLPAHAEPAPESAEALFVRARSLMKTGDCANALPLLEQSHTLEPRLGTRFNMAICEGRLGKLTQALEHLRSVVDASSPTDERRSHAERALKELMPRIPYLVLELDEARHELELVRLDGQPLPSLRMNEPFAINPGTHDLEVVLARETPQVRRFRVVERQTYTWSLSGTSVTQPAAASNQPNPGTVPEDATTEPRELTWTTQRTIAAVVAGTSVAAFGVGAGFALSARSVYDSANCPDDLCDRDAMKTRERARAQGNIATVAVTVGVASALGAVTLWLTGAPRSPKPSKPVRLGVHLDGTGRPGGGIVFEGNY